MQENRKCKENIANLVGKNAKLEKQIIQLKEKLKIHDGAEKTIKELQEQIEELQKQHLEKDKSLARIQEENIVLKKEMRALENKNAIDTLWREQKTRDLEGFDKLKKEAKEMSSNINDLKHQNEALTKKCQEKENMIKELQNLLENEQTKNQNAQEALNKEKLSRCQDTAKLEIVADLNNKVQSLQSEKDCLLGKLNTYENQAKSYEKQIKTMAENIQRENTKNKELLELLDMKTSEGGKLHRELQSKNKQLEGLEEEAVKARKIINRLQLELEKLNHQVRNDQETNTHLVSTLNKQNQAMKKEVKDSEDKIQELIIKVATLNNQIEHVEGKFFNSQTDLRKSKKENTSLKELNVTLDRKVSEIKDELENITSENQSLNDQLDQMKKQMEEAEEREKEKMSIVNKELIKMKDTLAVTEVEKQRLEKELEDFKQEDLGNSRKVEEMEEKIKHLIEENNNLQREKFEIHQFYTSCWEKAWNQYRK